MLPGRVKLRLGLDASLDGYLRHAQDVSDFGFLEARCVILKRQLIELLIDLEAPQAVGVRKLAESAELFGAQGPLQFVGYFHQGHAWIIATWIAGATADLHNREISRFRREAELIVGSSVKVTAAADIWRSWEQSSMRREDG